MAEAGRQTAEVRGQTTDDRGQKTEVRGQRVLKSEVGPGVVPKGRDYAAAWMRKSGKDRR